MAKNEVEFMASEMMAQIPPLLQLKDRFDNEIFVGNSGDYWSPPFPIGGDSDFCLHARDIRNMEIRDDDVIMVGYPKSGSHWHADIIGMLMTGKAQYCGMYENDGDLSVCDLDILPSAKVNAMTSRRLLHTHVPFGHFPKQAFKKQTKVVYVERNPKDVYVSFYHHLHSNKKPLNYPGTFEQFFYLMLESGHYYGDLLQYLMAYQEGMEEHPELPVYVSVFEEQKKDPVDSVMKINDHLGTGCSKKVCGEIAEACSFQKLKKRKDQNADNEEKSVFKSGELRYFRKGQIGDWKNHFTVAMNEQFDKHYKGRMAGYKRPHIFE